ncbi:MAG: hypothetical protein HY263_11730 [Chloroflexi bacterium]|nr:hypothetical protein [Chloroflexota bacterium]
MRIYEGSPRQDFEEVFRSIGGHLDALGMREVLLLETEDAFILQGLVFEGSVGTWSDAVGQVRKQTVVLHDDDLGAFMDESLAKRGTGRTDAPDSYESALRVIGRYLEEVHPRDTFLFEQGGSYVLRLLHVDQAGSRHELVEFTRDDIAQMVAQGPALRAATPPKAGSAPS